MWQVGVNANHAIVLSFSVSDLLWPSTGNVVDDLVGGRATSVGEIIAWIIAVAPDCLGMGRHRATKQAKN